MGGDPSDAKIANDCEEYDSYADEKEGFGAWLKKTREGKNYSILDLAEQSGVSHVAIRNIESGISKNPQARTRAKLEKALDSQIPDEIIQESESGQNVSGLGNLIDFDPHQEEDLPNVRGVYVFYDISNRPIYVGRSTKQGIASRVRQHYEKFWFKRPIVNNGAYIQIDDEDLCKKVELVLIRFLKSHAVLNKQGVSRDEDD